MPQARQLGRKTGFVYVGVFARVGVAQTSPAEGFGFSVQVGLWSEAICLPGIWRRKGQEETIG